MYGDLSSIKNFAIAPGAVSAVLGIIVMVGWYTSTIALIQVHSTFVPMQFNTATGFLLSGVMLMTMSRAPRASIACAVVLATMAVLTLLQYIFVVDFGIDQLLWHHEITVGTSHAGRMAPNTATCFAIAGVAILLASATVDKSAELILGISGSLVLGLGLVGALGYSLGPQGMYGWGSMTQMALHTALGFIVVGMGLLMLGCKEVPNRNYLPRWTPVLAGTVVLAITTSLHNALHLHQHIELAHNLVFFFGATLALILAWAVNRAQAAQNLTSYALESEERLRFTLESTHDGYWDWNIQTDEVFFSDGFIDMFGLGSGGLEPSIDAWQERIHPQDKGQVLQSLRDHLDGRSASVQTEYRFRTKSGAWMWIQDRNKVIARDAEGSPLRAVGTCTDISDRKQVDLELRESQRRYQRLFDDSPISLWEEDFSQVSAFLDKLKVTGITDFRQYFDDNPDQLEVCVEKVDILDVNRATLVLHEAENKQDLLGNLNTTFGENSMDVFKEELILLAEGRRYFESDVQVKTLTGQDKDVHLQFSVTKSLEGDGSVALVALTDITERRQAEFNLNQVQKMEAVGQLTGGIAHDFNNLLSIVKGNLRFLREDIGETDADIDELFEDAMSAVDDGAELTKRLMGFSRSRSLVPESRDVNDTIEEFIRFLSRTIGEQIALEFESSDAAMMINVDPSQLDNALLNLSLNARDAMPEGGVITFSATPCHHDGDDGQHMPVGHFIKISVTDTGSGINRQDLQHVYEPFFTTKEIGKGSGLGLSMVYGFTQQSNGSCSIDSTLGAGTSVSMYFPEFKERRVRERETANDGATIFGHREVILVVEDEPRVRRVVLHQLKRLGYRSLEAANASEAKEILESGEAVDLLFSDVLMPGEMDGYMLARWTEENYPGVKILLTSGYSRDKTGVGNGRPRSFPMIKKPFMFEKLAEQIGIALGSGTSMGVE